MTYRIYLAILAVSCALWTGCGGSAGSPPPPPPALSCSPASQTVNVGVAANFSAANGNGTYSWTAPNGSPASGSGTTFSTTYSAAGTDTVTVTSGGKSASCSVTVSNAQQKPVITSPLTATGTVGTPFSYQITATNNPTSFDATGLPAGLSVNQTTGQISGTPSAAGVSNVTISATNGAGTGSATLVLTVNPPPTLTCSPSSQTVNIGQSATLTAAGGIGTYSWSAPGGNPASGSGSSFSTSYAAAGTKTVTVTSGSQNASCTVIVNSANQWNTFYAPPTTSDEGFRLLANGSSVFVADLPTINTTDHGAGVVKFDLNGNVLDSWNTGAVPAAIYAMAPATGSFYTAGITGGDSAHPQFHEAWIAEFQYGANPLQPSLSVAFQLNGKQTEAYGLAIAGSQIFLAVRTQDLVCGLAFGACSGDRVVVTDLSGNIVSSFEVGNTPSVKVADATNITGIAVSADGQSIYVAGDRYNLNGSNLVFAGDYWERYSPSGALLAGPVVGGDSGTFITFDGNGNLYFASTHAFTASNVQMCAYWVDPQTIATKFAPCWNGGNSGPTSVNTTYGVFPNPQGGVVLTGSLSQISGSGTDGGAWAVDLTKCTGSGCGAATLWTKRTTSVTGGTVSRWDYGFVDSSGNVFLTGLGSDGSTSCGQASCTEAVLSKNP